MQARGRPASDAADRSETGDLTLFLLRAHDPHVLLHITALDGVQQRFGPGSPEAAETLQAIDGLLAEIADAIKASGRPVSPPGDRSSRSRPYAAAMSTTVPPAARAAARA